MKNMDQRGQQPLTEAPRPKTGRRVVYGMFGFGLLMVGLLWGYWELYTRPFRPLQYAIADAYPASGPRVVGGRHKSHKLESPITLRIVVRVPHEDFNPAAPEHLEQCERRALELARLAYEYQSLEGYDVLDVHLIQRVPEQADRRWSVSRRIGEWVELLRGD